MMTFRITILGSGSATPTKSRNPSAQVLNVLERFFLIDCAEGTQQQMLKYGVKGQKISHILISHLHGDHFFGLIGLLTSFSLLGRNKDMHIYCPAPLQEIIELQLMHSGTELRYALHFHTLEPNKKAMLFEDKAVRVKAFPLYHRIHTWGFRIDEKTKPRTIIKEKLGEYRIPVDKIEGIKQGNDFETPDGKVIPNEELTEDPPEPRSYAYCSDTVYNEKIIPQIEGVTALYHEATFGHDMRRRAEETLHTTSKQAARIAAKAKVGQLIIGHFSARYRNVDPLLHEAKEVFENTIAAHDGLTVDI